MENPEPDLDLPPDVLAIVTKAGGSLQKLKGMRGVNKVWQQGFEMVVAGITITLEHPRLPSGEDFAQRFPKLLHLDVGKSRAEESWLEILPKAFPNLTSLVLGHELNTPNGYHQSLASRLSNTGLEHIWGLPLSSLSLAHCRGVTSLGTSPGLLGGGPLLKAMPLAHLDLSGCTHLKLTLEDLLGLPLTSLSLKGCSWVAASTLSQLRKLPSLEVLDLSDCPSLPDEGLSNLRGLPLTKLTLGSWRGLSDDATEALEGLPLTDLRLCNGHRRLTPEGLFWLGEMPLRSLSLDGGVENPDEGFAFLVSLPLIRLKVQFSTSCDSVCVASFCMMAGDMIPIFSESKFSCPPMPSTLCCGDLSTHCTVD